MKRSNRLARLVLPLLPHELRRYVQRRTLGAAIQYYFFQRLLRINSHVPWPVHWTSTVTSPHNIVRKSVDRPEIGGSPGQYIQAINGIVFGKNVRLGPGVKLVSADHDLYNYDTHVPCGPIEIGDHCWLGANAVVLSGVKLGDHVVVAAGAVVTKSFSHNCVIGGVPARVLKKLEPYQERSDHREPSV